MDLFDNTTGAPNELPSEVFDDLMARFPKAHNKIAK